MLAEAPQLTITATSKPNTTQAQALLDKINARVDSFLNGAGYRVPITGPQSVTILKEIVISGAIAQILKAMYFGIRNPDEIGANQAWREFQDRLKAIADPNDPTRLPDAALDQQGDKRTLDLGADALIVSEPVNEAFFPTRNQIF